MLLETRIFFRDAQKLDISQCPLLKWTRLGQGDVPHMILQVAQFIYFRHPYREKSKRWEKARTRCSFKKGCSAALVWNVLMNARREEVKALSYGMEKLQAVLTGHNDSLYSCDVSHSKETLKNDRKLGEKEIRGKKHTCWSDRPLEIINLVHC